MNDIQNIIGTAEQIESRLGYRFINRELLALAFTHCSYVNECRIPLQHNERLEFLGDSILGLIVSAYLYRQLPDVPEGDLSSIRARLVEANSCISYIQKLDLEKYLVLGKGERMNDGRGRDTILSDLFEAILGAIFLDGGLEAAQTFFFDRFKDDIDAILQAPLKNPKATLQDYCQKHFQQTPQYHVLGEKGPDHSKIFEVAVLIQDIELGIGEGPSKKEAQQAAAKNALATLNQMGVKDT
jgi:ribonuclease III